LPVLRARFLCTQRVLRTFKTTVWHKIPKEENKRTAGGDRPDSLPVNGIHPIGQVVDLDDGDLELRKLSEIAEPIRLPETLDEKQKTAGIVRAIELYERLEPQDGAGGLIAAQMTGTHLAALECLRRAAVPGQTL
jgi:hypothetical protein